MRLIYRIFLALTVSCSVPAQTYSISTFAGLGLPVNVPGTAASLAGSVNGVAVDVDGNVFFSNGIYFSRGLNVMRLDATTGILSLVAETGASGIALDSAGSVYLAGDSIRKVSGGVITTVAGNGPPGFSGDNGPATSAQLNSSYGIAVDSAGSLYIADTFNHLIRKVSGGVITTVAGIENINQAQPNHGRVGGAGWGAMSLRNAIEAAKTAAPKVKTALSKVRRLSRAASMSCLRSSKYSSCSLWAKSVSGITVALASRNSAETC